MITIENQLLKKIDIHPQFTYDNFSYHYTLRFPLTLFQFAFGKFHEHSHAGLHIAQYIFHQYPNLPFPQKRLSIFLLDCIDCQIHKFKERKQNKAANLTLSKLSTF